MASHELVQELSAQLQSLRIYDAAYNSAFVDKLNVSARGAACVLR